VKKLLYIVFTIFILSGCRVFERYPVEKCTTFEEPVTAKESRDMLDKDSKRRHKTFYRDPTKVKLTKEQKSRNTTNLDR
jgi:hypothetical protein